MLIAQRLRERLFTARPPDPGITVLGQRRIFIVPSAVGALFAVVMAVMYAGAVNYNLGLGHVLVFLLVSVGHTGLVYGFRNLYGLQILAGRAPPVFAGETASFSIRFENDRAEPRRALLLRRDRREPGIPFDVPASGSTTIELPAPATARGWLTLGRLTLSTHYPLGLFYAWSTPHPAMRCLVFPKPLSRALPPPRAGQRPGGRLEGSGDEDFSGLRTRQPGDSPRHIAWKSFARDPENRPLQVKQFAGGNPAETWLCWSDLPTAMDVETRLSVLTGWVIAADDARTRYGLQLPGGQIEPGEGSGHRLRCLTELALFGLARE